MTFNELYEYGMKSEPANLCIPQELVQSLPRLERINGKIVVQYWYYYRKGESYIGGEKNNKNNSEHNHLFN